MLLEEAHRWPGRGIHSTPKQKCSPPPTFWCQKTLLRLYLTIPATLATSQRTFSALRQLKNYLRSTMKQAHLNNCLLMHCHKSITNTLLEPTNNAKGTLHLIWVGICIWLSGRWIPQVSKHSAASEASPGYPRFQVTGMTKGFFWFEVFDFGIFSGWKILASIFFG